MNITKLLSLYFSSSNTYTELSFLGFLEVHWKSNSFYKSNNTASPASAEAYFKACSRSTFWITGRNFFGRNQKILVILPKSISNLYMPFSTPHPLWTSAGPSPSKVAMASVQEQMVPSRYRTEGLCRHWSMKDKTVHCLLSAAWTNTVEDILHIILHCVGSQWKTLQDCVYRHHINGERYFPQL